MCSECSEKLDTLDKYDVYILPTKKHIKQAIVVGKYRFWLIQPRVWLKLENQPHTWLKLCRFSFPNHAIT